MESTETSVIARKLKNFYVTQHSRPQAVPRLKRPPVKVAEEAGIFKNIVLVSLMGIAVFLTELSLRLIKYVRRLET